jgi:hypothetical protein
MLRTISTLAIAAAVGGGTTAAAFAAPHIYPPKRPSVTVGSVTAAGTGPAVKHLAELKVTVPTITPPKQPRPAVKHLAELKVTAPTITPPKQPRPAVKHLAELKVTAPTITPPKQPRLDLRPAGCSTATCSPEDPTAMAGTVVSFNGSELTERTKSGHTYTAAVDDTTKVACPTQQAIEKGRVFNPATPAIPKVGVGQVAVPATPTITDEYACSATDITAGRHIAGAELGRDSNGRLHWIAVAVAPR